MYFGIRETLKAVVASLSMSFILVGNIAFALRGVVIGGLTSRVAVATLFAAAEDCRRNSAHVQGTQTTLASNDRTAGMRPEKVTGIIRYVDDILLLSRLICGSCLIPFAESLYSLKVEITGSLPKLRFPDVQLVASGMPVACIPWNVNRNFLLIKQEHRETVRYPPFITRTIST